MSSARLSLFLFLLAGCQPTATEKLASERELCRMELNFTADHLENLRKAIGEQNKYQIATSLAHICVEQQANVVASQDVDLESAVRSVLMECQNEVDEAISVAVYRRNHPRSPIKNLRKDTTASDVEDILSMSARSRLSAVRRHKCWRFYESSSQ